MILVLIIEIIILILEIVILLTLYNKYNRKEPEKITTNKNKVKTDIQINSLKFNTELDGYILELLNKYSNQEIADIIAKKLKNKYNLDYNELQKYVLDTLKYYNNKYDKNINNNITIDNLEEEINQKNNNEFNLTNTINNFYKD